MIVLVTGGRSYTDRARVFAELDRIHAETPIAWLVNGACPTGADAHANAWCVERGRVSKTVIRRRRYFADWARRGRSAGPERNARMVEGVVQLAAGGAALCLAFPGGTGTADCVRRARAAGIEVREVGS